LERQFGNKYLERSAVKRTCEARRSSGSMQSFKVIKDIVELEGEPYIPQTLLHTFEITTGMIYSRSAGSKLLILVVARQQIGQVGQPYLCGADLNSLSCSVFDYTATIDVFSVGW
jgi:hypothetical protein